MFNIHLADPQIKKGFQIWFYQYTSGNPIPYSAGTLRDALKDTVSTLDPEGKDPALRQMVVVGHSQGGLLTRMTVVQGGEQFWQATSGGLDMKELDLRPQDEAL